MRSTRTARIRTIGAGIAAMTAIALLAGCTSIRDHQGYVLDEPLVAAHAVRRPDGSVAVLLLNKDPESSLAVELSGLASGADARRFTYSSTTGGVIQGDTVALTGPLQVDPSSIILLEVPGG